MIIEVIVAPDGSVTTKVQGGTGKGCAVATKAIREAMGQTIEDRKLPEYYQPAAQPNKQGAGR